MASIGFENVTKRYDGGQVALSGLTLDVEEGEFLILVGPSGCGKSTALRIAAGLDSPSSGILRIGGKIATDAAPRDRNIAMIFQSYALYPHLSVARNIGFGLRVRGMAGAEIERHVREAAATLELTEYLDRKPAQLSGGQRQRVAMARALVRSPNAFLMDEPLSNLDARLRGHMRQEIAALQRRRRITTIYVTHDQVEAMTMGSRIAVMDRGVLQQVGSPRDLYDAPVNRFVAGFLGSPAMNFIAAVVENGPNGLAALQMGPHRLALGAAHTAQLAGFGRKPGAPIVLGLRPEGFRIASNLDGAVLPATVRFVEDLGAATLVSVEVDGVSVLRGAGGGDDDLLAALRHLKVSLNGRPNVAVGDAIRLALEPSQFHFFDNMTGQALRSRPAVVDPSGRRALSD